MICIFLGGGEVGGRLWISLNLLKYALFYSSRAHAVFLKYALDLKTESFL